MSEFDDLFEEEESESQNQERNNPVRSLREALKAKDKEAKQLSKELAELKAFKVQYDQEKKIEGLASSFEKVGLTPKHAELFFKLNPEAEVNDESIVSFAKEYSLPIKLAESEEGGENITANEPFLPASGGSADETGYVTREQLDKMYAENPRKALQVLSTGKVKWNNPDD